MIVKLSLTQKGAPAAAIREITLAEGSLVVGRAADCDWSLDDEERVLSRRHCKFTIVGDRIQVEDTSANGIRVNDGKKVLGQGSQADLTDGDRVELGNYVISIEIDSQASLDETQIAAPPSEPPNANRDRELQDEQLEDTISQTLFLPEGAVAAKEIPAVKSDDVPLFEDEVPLLEDGGAAFKGDDPVAAFLDGAGLDRSIFSSAGTVESMHLAGRLYSQMVHKLCELLNDRAVVKAQFRAEQTLVSRDKNNPFKFLVPDDLAAELFKQSQKGFMGAEEAVGSSFRDLKRHQSAVLAGMQTAVYGVLTRLNPDEVEEQVAARKTFGILASGGRKSAAWDDYRALFDQVESEMSDLDRSIFMDHFRKGYEDHIQKLIHAESGTD